MWTGISNRETTHYWWASNNILRCSCLEVLRNKHAVLSWGWHVQRLWWLSWGAHYPGVHRILQSPWELAVECSQFGCLATAASTVYTRNVRCLKGMIKLQNAGRADSDGFPMIESICKENNDWVRQYFNAFWCLQMYPADIERQSFKTKYVSQTRIFDAHARSHSMYSLLACHRYLGSNCRRLR